MARIYANLIKSGMSDKYKSINDAPKRLRAEVAALLGLNNESV